MLKNYIEKMQPKEASPKRKPMKKILWSGLGAFLGIYGVVWLARAFGIETLFLVGSFGASAVLIYGAPQADFSQPRNLLGGHIISAFVGVAVHQFFLGDVALEASVAVSLSIVAMHLTRTLHPPGGATALIAVIGGEEIYTLGYGFVLAPIGMGSLVMLFVALVINNLSANPKRHYPKYWY